MLGLCLCVYVCVCVLVLIYHLEQLHIQQEILTASALHIGSKIKKVFFVK